MLLHDLAPPPATRADPRPTPPRKPVALAVVRRRLRPLSPGGGDAVHHPLWCGCIERRAAPRRSLFRLRP